MDDDFSVRYGDLLTGSYDCVDRIVLNAYYPLGHYAGGFRVWWRRRHGDSDQDLDDAHLMRLSGRFARRVRRRSPSSSITTRTVADRTRSRLDVPALRILFGVKQRRIGMQTLFRDLAIETHLAA